MKSKFLSLNWHDVKKSIHVVLTTSVIPAILVVLDGGRFPTLGEWRTFALLLASSWCGYLLKNIFTNSEDKFLTEEKSEDAAQ